MNHTIHEKEVEQSVYEIGYLIVSSIPEERVLGEVDAIKALITDTGALVLGEETAHLQPLAYTMSKKTVSGGYDKYDSAYFGWIKFELGSDKIESLKKSIELHPSVLRMLLISTVKENTYLGRRSSLPTMSASPVVNDKGEEKKDAVPATIEEMDKSIENMVKEA